MVSSTILLTTVLLLATPLLANPLSPRATLLDPFQTRAVFDLYADSATCFKAIPQHSPGRNAGDFDIQGPADTAAGTFRLGFCSNFSFPATTGGLSFGGIIVDSVATFQNPQCAVHIYTGKNCEKATEVPNSPFQPVKTGRGCKAVPNAHSYNVTCTA